MENVLLSSAAVAITKMLINIIGIKVDGKTPFKAEDLCTLPYWPLANTDESIEKLFCMSFLMFEVFMSDHPKSDLSKAIKDVKNQLFFLLQLRPKSVDEMYIKWTESKGEDVEVRDIPSCVFINTICIIFLSHIF